MFANLTKTPKSSSSSELLGHPTGLFVLSVAELFERFSYYGMRALLMLYMVSELHYADEKAYGVYSLYAALAYAAPLIGGYLADKIIGFKRAIIMGSFVIASGHLFMAMPFGEGFFYCGLGLIISGTGLFKSNVSALVGKLYEKEDQRRDAGYTLFYLGINVGGFLAPFACGYMGHRYGWHYGFGIAGLGMIIGALILLAKSSYFAPMENLKKGGVRSNRLSQLTLYGGLLAGPVFAGMVYANDTFSNLMPIIGIGFLAYVFSISLKATSQERRNILVLMLAILLLLLSGALVEQSGMALTLFIERNVDKSILGFQIPTAFFQSIDPMTVLLLGGFFSALWMKLAKGGRDLSASSKYALGFCFIGLSYAVIYLGCLDAMDTSGIAPAWYAILSMMLLAVGDICIYPVALSLCSSLSPKRYEGVLMGGVMMGVSFSYIVGGVLAKFASVDETVLETLDIQSSIGIYSDLFYGLAVTAAVCILLTLGAGLWMNKKPALSGLG